MKSVLLYANEDTGLESRFQAALDVARAFESHISCVQVTPFDSFIMGDPFGGVYALPSVLEAVREAEDERRAGVGCAHAQDDRRGREADQPRDRGARGRAALRAPWVF